ncbi:c-type cytochrome [Chromatocurvus halotolerans]|uniref:peptidylprolyl isomerase n=1 Tax=Chromatocurvus halotolerans TaxID=1132028 RepID=A0A4R2L7G5_9GAMM|nr:c-type cytochrome [Chromatocurvus halotolerans]TCO75165.1 FKBP-type peptidyl-prolyl isomerase-like protein [Chromatocurvus halotolerans]
MARSSFSLTCWIFFWISTLSLPTQSAQYQAGVDYQVLSPPLGTTNSRIAFVEFFASICAHCYDLEGTSLANWKASLPTDVVTVRSPVFWNDPMELHARAYLAAESLGIADAAHLALYEAIHLERRRLLTEAELAEVFATLGVGAAEFSAAFNSATTQERLNQARQRAESTGIPGVPAFLIAGKYLITPRSAGGRETMLDVAEYLFSRVREERGMPAPAPEAFVIDDDADHWNADIGLMNGGVIPAAAAQLFRVYYGALGRLPDGGGFRWWSGEINEGRHDLRSMAAGFVFSNEFQRISDGDADGTVSDSEFIAHMYRNVFGREPDPDGAAWWTAELSSGRRSQADVLVAMTQSNEYVELTLEPVSRYLPQGGDAPPAEDGPPPSEPPPEPDPGSEEPPVPPETGEISLTDEQEAKYDKSCRVCHEVGVAGAPRTGSSEDWAPRLAKGMDALLTSVRNGFNAMPPRGMCFDCNDDDYRALIHYMSSGPTEAETENAREAREFLASNALRQNVIVTASGLQYEILQTGFGPSPSVISDVEVHYQMTLLDGTVIDSSYQQGEPARLRLNAVIDGLSEGIRLMNVGSIYRFYVLADLAYGAAVSNFIEPDAALIIDVELLGVEGDSGIDGQAIYNQACAACHMIGVAGAPVLGNADQWAPRIARGLEALYTSALNGLVGTPMVAKGGRSDLSDEQVKAAVRYMVNNSL